MGFFKNIGKGLKKIGKGVAKVADGAGEALFGTKTAAAARRGAKEAAENTGNVGKQAKKYGRQFADERAAYDKAAQESMGANAGEYVQKAQDSASALAEQQGQTAATQGTKAAIRSARTSGLSKGQSALAGAQQAGDIYSNTYGQGMQQGINNYQGATQQIAGQGSEMANRQQNAMNTQLGAATGQANIAGQQGQAAAAKSAQTWGTIGTVAGAGIMALSDENAKTNIVKVGEKAKAKSMDEIREGLNSFSQSGLAQGSSFGKGLASGMQVGSAVKEMFDSKKAAKAAAPTPAASGIMGKVKGILSDENAKMNIEDMKKSLASLDIDDIAKKIRPVKFEYKPEVVEEGKAEAGEHLGVIAQDLEKTPLASAVKMGDDGLKRIDTSELSPAILNLVIQLAQKVQKLEGDK